MALSPEGKGSIKDIVEPDFVTGFEMYIDRLILQAIDKRKITQADDSVPLKISVAVDIPPHRISLLHELCGAYKLAGWNAEYSYSPDSRGDRYYILELRP